MLWDKDKDDDDDDDDDKHKSELERGVWSLPVEVQTAKSWMTVQLILII